MRSRDDLSQLKRLEELLSARPADVLEWSRNNEHWYRADARLPRSLTAVLGLRTDVGWELTPPAGDAELELRGVAGMRCRVGRLRFVEALVEATDVERHLAQTRREVGGALMILLAFLVAFAPLCVWLGDRADGQRPVTVEGGR